MAKLVQVTEIVSGAFKPVLYWGQGEDMDREAYDIAFINLADAETAAAAWAKEKGADYKPYAPHAPNWEMIERIKALRIEGLGLGEAVRQARAEMGS